jgi:hypothetical protein
VGDPSYNYASYNGMMGYQQANHGLILPLLSHNAPVLQVPLAEVTKWHSRGPDIILETLDKGLLHPTTLGSTFSIEVYVDADFAGGWGYEDPNDPVSVNSRTGFIVEIMGCPIQWTSKLQTNIATSTMEAEYTALSIALRTAMPLLDVIKYVVRSFNVTSSSLLTFKTPVHEDNQGALRLANKESGE